MYFEKDYKYVFVNQKSYTAHLTQFLCWMVENTKWIVCTEKPVFNDRSIRFLAYKYKY